LIFSLKAARIRLVKSSGRFSASNPVPHWQIFRFISFVYSLCSPFLVSLSHERERDEERVAERINK